MYTIDWKLYWSKFIDMHHLQWIDWIFSKYVYSRSWRCLCSLFDPLVTWRNKRSTGLWKAIVWCTTSWSTFWRWRSAYRHFMALQCFDDAHVCIVTGCTTTKTTCCWWRRAYSCHTNAIWIQSYSKFDRLVVQTDVWLSWSHNIFGRQYVGFILCTTTTATYIRHICYTVDLWHPSFSIVSISMSITYLMDSNMMCSCSTTSQGSTVRESDPYKSLHMRIVNQSKDEANKHFRSMHDKDARTRIQEEKQRRQAQEKSVHLLRKYRVGKYIGWKGKDHDLWHTICKS